MSSFNFLRGRKAAMRLASLALTANAAWVPAFAQQAEAPAGQPAPAAPPVAVDATPAAGQETSLEEVVVTARRRQESQQNVPVAITAMSSDDLRDQHIEDGQDLQGRIPSLVVGSAGQTRNTETVTIRGQGATYGSSPGVVIYYDEVPLPADSVTNGQGGPGKYFDLSSMQVLKGSQGTLFGRNTTGGALLLAPTKPTERYEGSVQGTFSNYGGLGNETIANFPVIQDKLLVRLGFKYEDRDGYTKDVATGVDYDNKHYWTGRLGITLKPIEGVENYLLGYWTRSADNGTGNVLTNINSSAINLALATSFAPPNGCDNFNALTGSANCGQDFVQQQQARGPRNVILSAQPRDVLETGGVIDTLSWSINDNLTVRNIASYHRYEHSYHWDLDGSKVPFDDVITPSSDRSSNTSLVTEELQLQGTAHNSRLVYVVGGYYDKSKPEGQEQQLSDLLFTPAPSHTGKTRQSYAPYAQATYDLGDLFSSIDGLKFTAGLRYTQDKLDAFSDYYVDHGAQVKGSALTWTAGLDYKLPEGTLLYGKVSRGYKSGDFSPLAVTPTYYTFSPEHVTNVEIGQKSDFHIATMPVRVNAALYSTDYTNLQRASGDVYSPGNNQPTRFGGAVFNAGSATIQGVELEGTIKPVHGLEVAASYSYTFAKYDTYNIFVGNPFGQLDCSGAVVPVGGTANLSCIPFQFVPKHQASLSVRYLLPIADHYGDVSVSSTYAWTDRQFSAPASIPSTEPNAYLGAYGLLNAALDWDNILRSQFDLQLFVTNATDRTYRISNSNIYNALYSQSSIYGDPRMFGAIVRFHWGQ